MEKKVWMTDSGSFDVVCPECDTMFAVHVEVASTQTAVGKVTPDLPAKSFQAGKPPEVGDWVIGQCRKCGRNVSTSEIGGERPAKQDWLCPDCAISAPPEERPTTARPIYPPPPNKPKVGDWVVGTEELRMADPKDWPYWSKPHKILRIYSEIHSDIADFGPGFACRLKYLRIVRLRDAPLQKGDRGLLGNVEVWISFVENAAGQHIVVFGAEDVGKHYDGGVDAAWIQANLFCLTEPVYPDGEKLSGKEKED